MIIWMTRISTALNRELDPEDEQVEAFSHLILVRGGHRRRKTGVAGAVRLRAHRGMWCSVRVLGAQDRGGTVSVPECR